MCVKKAPIINAQLQGKYEEYVKGNEFPTFPEALETGNIRKMIGVSSERIEEALKFLKIDLKILNRRSNILWDILLATEQDAKQLGGEF